MKHKQNFDLYLHFGPHKTGTTSFQHFLEKNSNYLLSKNITLLTIRTRQKKSYRIWRRRYLQCVERHMLNCTIEDQIAQNELTLLVTELSSFLQDGTTAMIISDENLLGPIPGHFFAAGKERERDFYSAQNTILKVFKKVFSSQIKSVLVSRRDPYDFIISSYRDFMFKLVYAQRPKVFYGELKSDFLKQYNDFYSNFNMAFGNKVHIIGFKQFISNLQEVLDIFTNISLKLEYPLKKPSNQSMSWRAVEVALTSIPLLESDEEKSILKKYLTDGLIDGKIPIDIEDELKEIENIVKNYSLE